MGFAGGEDWMTGHMYIFHNTIFREDEWLPQAGWAATASSSTPSRGTTSSTCARPRATAPARTSENTDNDFDYDLYNGRVPKDQEAHGVRGEPVYAAGAGFDPAAKTGRFQLAPGSPGAGTGVAIPNFSDGYTGPAPDVGAHQRGAPPVQFGVGAKQ